MDPRSYFAHKIRNDLQSLALVLSLGGLVAGAGYLLGGFWGVLAVGAAWGLTVALSPSVSPLFVLRLYRAAPIEAWEAPGLHAATRELAARAALGAVPRLYYIPSRSLNAVSLGSRRQPFIGLTDGLLRTLDDRELFGVLAHEVSHIKNRDLGVIGLADSIGRLTFHLSFVGQILAIAGVPYVLATGRATLLYASLFLMVAPVVSVLLRLGLSRTREFHADLDAARLTGDPLGLASALEKLEVAAGGFWRRFFWPRRPEGSAILRTHPHTRERIARLLEMARREGVGAQEVIPCRGCPEHWVAVGRAPRWHWTGFWY
jgi:heat shock protein HtpX